MVQAAWIEHRAGAGRMGLEFLVMGGLEMGARSGWFLLRALSSCRSLRYPFVICRSLAPNHISKSTRLSGVVPSVFDITVRFDCYSYGERILAHGILTRSHPFLCRHHRV